MATYSLATSMWGPDADEVLSDTFNNLYFEFGSDPDHLPGQSFGGGFDAAVISASVSVGVLVDFTVGLGLKSTVDFVGDLALDYVFDPHAQVSTAAATLNAKSYVDTSGFQVTGATLQTSGLDPEASNILVDFAAKLKLALIFFASADAEVDIGVDSWSDDWFDFWVLPIIDTTYTDQLTNGHEPYQLIDSTLIDITLGVPANTAQSTNTLVADATDGLSNLSTSHSSDTFFDLDVDVLKILARLAKQPTSYLSGRIDLGGNGFFIEGEYTTIAGLLVEKASLRQEFAFDADTVDVSMVSSFGATDKIGAGFTETITGELGDKFEFTTPEGEGTFTVTASYHLHGTLSAKSYIDFETSLELQLLAGSLEAGIEVSLGPEDFDINIDGGSFGPLFVWNSGALATDTLLINEWSKSVDLGTMTETYTIAWEKFYTGTAGNDTFTMTTNQVTVDGLDGKDRITGNALDNLIFGGGGNDTLFGLAGADTLNGGEGADALNGGTGSDTASYEGAARGVLADLQQANRNTYSAKGDSYASVENLTGSSYADVLWGDSGINLLIGGLGNDEIHGRAGNDTLVGGLGADQLSGESGYDVFAYNSAAEGGDNIGDFSTGDKIALSASAFGISSLVDGVNFIAGARPSAGTATATLLYDKTQKNLYFDADGNGGGAVVLIAHVTGQPLTVGDFVLFA